jgi:hypothetical protein
MGMSGDFEIAIQEGATIVRVGTAFWEEYSEPLICANTTLIDPTIFNSH